MRKISRARSTGRKFRIEDTRIWLDRRLIRRAGKDHYLQPKVMDVLAVLVARAGDVVPRVDLLQSVWGPDGSDDLLSNAIWKLRKALGDEAPDGSHLIETIPKYGYRLTSRPEPIAASSPAFRKPLWLSAAILVGMVGLTFLAWSLGTAPREAPGFSAQFLSLVPITGVKSGPSFSPDGRHVAYVSSLNSYHTDLYLYDRETGESRPLLSDLAWNFHPAFNRRDQVAVFRYVDGQCRIELVDAGTGRRFNGFDCGRVDGRSLKWSRDGRRLLVSEARDDGFFPVAIDAATGDRSIILDGSGRTLLAPVQSPDGRELAVIERLAEGGERVFVTTDAASPVYSQIGALEWVTEQILLFSAESGESGFDLWRWDIDSGDAPVHLARIPGRNTQLSIDPVSLAVAFDATRSTTDLWLLDKASVTSPARIATTVADEYHPALRSDGKRIAWLADQPRRGSVWTRALPEGQATRVDFVDFEVHSIAWLGEDRLVASAIVDGAHDLYMIELRTESSEPLVATADEEMAPSVTRDGRYVFFSAQTGQGWKGFRYEVASGLVRPVDAPGLRIMRPSSDGNRVYFTRVDQPGLWLSDIDGLSVRQVTARLPADDWGNWSVGDTSAVVVDRFNGGNRLVWVTDGQHEAFAPIRLSGNVVRGANISIGGPGQLAVAMRNNYEGDVLMLEARQD